MLSVGRDSVALEGARRFGSIIFPQARRSLAPPKGPSGGPGEGSARRSGARPHSLWRPYPFGVSSRAFASSGNDEFAIQVEALRGSLFSQSRATDSICPLRRLSSLIVAAHCAAAWGSDDVMSLVKALTARSREGPSDKLPSQLAAADGSLLPQELIRFPNICARMVPSGNDAAQAAAACGSLEARLRDDGICCGVLRISGESRRHLRGFGRIVFRHGRNDAGQDRGTLVRVGQILRPIERGLRIILRPLPRNIGEQTVECITAAIR